jgi:hypothetical protein
VLGGEDLGDVLAMLIDELADAEVDLGAARERNSAPALERPLGSTDGAVDLLDGREVDLAGLDAARRVVDRATAAGLARDAGAVDPVVNALDRFAALSARCFRDFRRLAPPA